MATIESLAAMVDQLANQIIEHGQEIERLQNRVDELENQMGYGMYAAQNSHSSRIQDLERRLYDEKRDRESEVWDLERKIDGLKRDSRRGW